MKAELKDRKAKAGLLLVASPRFKNLSGPKRGTYGERKDKAVKEIKATMDFLDLVDPGIVYEREDAEKAIKLFFDQDVDFIYAEFLSWSEDFAWIRFLRDCPQIPIIFCNVAKDRMTFETTLDEDDFVDYLCAGTLVGSLEGSGSIKRIPRAGVKTVLGTRVQITEKVKTLQNIPGMRVAEQADPGFRIRCLYGDVQRRHMSFEQPFELPLGHVRKGYVVSHNEGQSPVVVLEIK